MPTRRRSSRPLFESFVERLGLRRRSVLLSAVVSAAAYLLAGALSAVAIAWAIALWGLATGGVTSSAMLEKGQLSGPGQRYDGTAIRGQFHPEPVPLNLLPHNGHFVHSDNRGPGISSGWFVTFDREDGRRFVRARHRTGWPFLALSYQAEGFSAAVWPDDPSGWSPAEWIPRSRHLEYIAAASPGTLPPVPLRPIPWALAVNTVFFGLVLFTLRASARFAGRALRRWRGRCPTCGYSRAGLATDALCPECGR